MAIPIARVHLAMAHAALPGLLPTPPKCMMLPLLPAPPCAAVILPNISPPKPSRADAADRWDAGKINPAGSPASPSSSSSGGWRSSSASSNRSSRSDSEERWDAHKKPASSPAASPSSSSSATSSYKTKTTCHIIMHPNRRMLAAAAERWDAHKKPRTPPAEVVDNDGERSTVSNDDVELDTPRQQQQPPPRSFYAGPGFIKSPKPSMLPMPSFMIRVA